MKKACRVVSLYLVFVFAPALEAKVFFLGKVVEANPSIDIVVVEGEPVENVRLGQVYDVALGDEIYAKAKATYVTDNGFEARIIDGSTQEIYEILKGEGEIISDFDGFTVLEVAEAQSAVLIFKSGNVRKVEMLDQTKDGFKVKDVSGQTLMIAAEDLRTIYYKEEPKYREFVKEETLIADVVPGEREREEARILEIKLRRKFSEAIRLATGFINSGQYSKALQQADEAIRLKPKEYTGYLVKARALMGEKNYTFSIAMLENALKLGGKKFKDLAEVEYNLALSYKGLGKLKEAKKYLEDAVDHGKDDLDTTFLLTDIQLEAGRFNEALSTTNWALQHKKGRPKMKARLYARAASIYLEKQYDLPRARTNIEAALKISPREPSFLDIRNKILLELSKKEEKELIDVSIIGGAWRTGDDQLYVSFFEETITVFLYKVDPLTNKLTLIIIGGDMTTSAEEELIIITNAKTQKFAGVSGRALKYSQIKQVSDNFFSGEEEVMEMDRDIAFKIKYYSPLKLTMLLDGTTFEMVPMDTEE